MLALLALLLTLPLSMPADPLPVDPLPAQPADAPAAVLRDCDGCECRSALEQVWSWLQRHESRITRLENAQRQCCPQPEEYSPAQPPKPAAAAVPNWAFALLGMFTTGLGFVVCKFTSGRSTERVCKYASGGVALLMAISLVGTSSAAEHHLPASGWRSADKPAAVRPLVPVQRDPFRQLEDRDGSYKLLQPFSRTAKVESTAAVEAIMAAAPQVQFMGLEDVAWKWTQPAPWHACALRLQTSDGSVGSGVYMQLAPNLGGVLTAKHVVSEIRSANQVEGRWIDGQQQRFTAIVPDRSGADLAFLVMSSPRYEVPPLHWTDRPPAAGEYLEAMGYGSGATTLRHYAMVYEGDAYRGKDRSDGQAMHGDSGGGILTLDSMNRVAVCSVVTNGEGQGYQSRGGRYYESMLFPSPAVVHEFLRGVVRSQSRRTSIDADDNAPTLELVQAQYEPTQWDPTQCPPGGCPQYGPPQQQQPQGAGRQYEQRDEPIFPDSSPYQIGPQQPQQGWGQQGGQQPGWGQRQDYCGPGGCPPQQPPGWGQHPQQPGYGQSPTATSPMPVLIGLLGVGGVVGLMYFLSQD